MNVIDHHGRIARTNRKLPNFQIELSESDCTEDWNLNIRIRSEVGVKLAQYLNTPLRPLLTEHNEVDQASGSKELTRAHDSYSAVHLCRPIIRHSASWRAAVNVLVIKSAGFSRLGTL